VVTAAVLIAAAYGLNDHVRPIQAATVLPICALTLATGGDDLPVLALCLLALAWCAKDRYTAAGLAVGAAGALKLFAWPVALVLLVHALTKGRSTATRFAAGAIGLPVVAMIPPALVDPGAFVENVIRFPLGHGLVTSPAQSPFPGHLIASGAPGGRAVAAVLLAAAGLGIAVALLRRTPRTATAAAFFCGYGLLAAILLMPSTRFGYLLYPIAFLVWAPALTSDISRRVFSNHTARPASKQ
jgi:glycosyl transferase family 87